MKICKNAFLRFILLPLVVISVVALHGGLAFAKEDDKKPQLTQTEKTQIIIKYKDDTKGDKLKSSVKGTLNLNKLETRKKYKKQKIELLEIDQKDDLNSVIEELKKDPNVAYVQPNYRLEISAAPMDSRFIEQWSLANNGQEAEGQIGRTGVDIGALGAWDITTGSSSVTIGLLDTGVDFQHEDLKANIVNGYDFVNGREINVSGSYTSKAEDLHGTQVAGIIAAAANEIGIRGVAPSIKIMPLKFMSGSSGYTCDAIAAIEYAQEHGIKIINASFGGTNENPALKEAIETSGILFVCAAGNNSFDSSTAPVYPAAFDLPNIISVAAIDNNGMLTASTTYGMKVDLAAPGLGVLTTIPDNSYDFMSGTSASAAHVTGIAALLLSQESDISPVEIKARIKNNVTSCASLQGRIGSGGRVNAKAVLTNIPEPSDNTLPTGTGGTGQGTNDQDTGDALLTMEQVSLLKEQLHFGENGVNPATGNLSLTNTDMSISSPGFQLNISRTYNSKDDRNSLLGRGWKFGFEGSIIGRTINYVTLPNGSVNIFYKNADGTYSAEDSRNKLVKNSDNTYTLTTKDQYKYHFTAMNINEGLPGWLDYMEDRNGNRITIDIIDYKTGKIGRITDAVGRTFTISYSNNHIASIREDLTGRKILYAYDNNKLVTVTDPMGNKIQYVYDSKGFLTQIKDNAGNILGTIVYSHDEGDNKDKATRMTDAFGATYTYTYDKLNKMTTTTEQGENGKKTIDWFDQSNYTIKSQDAEGRITETHFFSDEGKNKYGEIQSTVDRNGNVTLYERDESGNTVKITNPDQGYRTFTYDINNNLTSERDENGKWTFYVYDAEGKNLLKKVQPLTNDISTYVDGVSDPAKYAITTYSCYTTEYAAKGLVKTITDPEGNTTTFTYDGDGNVKTVTDGEANTTTYEYDRSGNKTAVISPGNHRTEYVYDLNGLLEMTKQNNGTEISRTTYDHIGRKTKEISPNQYDSGADDLATHTYSADAGFRYEYYSHGELKSVTDPEGNKTIYSYDRYGNKATETKPNGATYIYSYDKINRLIRVSFKASASATPVVLEEYLYAVTEDKRTQKTVIKYLNATEKATTVFIYDYADRLILQQNPDGGIIRTDYNFNGTVNWKSDAKGSITYFRYNGLNLLNEQWTPIDITNGTPLYSYSKFDYYKNGTKKSEAVGKEKVALWNVPAGFVTKNFTYCRNGKLNTVTDSAGRKTAFGYDPDGNVNRETVYVDAGITNVTEYVNNHRGKPTLKKVYTRAGELDTPETTLDTSYTYDKNGNLETVTTPNHVTTTFTYDKMNRKTSEEVPGQDEMGNKTGADGKPVMITTSTTYDWDGKPLIIKDALGNTTTNLYNPRGFLDSVQQSVTVNGVKKTLITSYAYDLAGRKIVEILPKNQGTNNRTEYVYDGMDRAKRKIEKFDEKHYDPATGQWSTTYITLTVRAYNYDYNGNVILEQDAPGIDGNYGTESVYNLGGKLERTLDTVSKEKGLSYTTKYEYDGVDRKIAEYDAKGVKTQYEYDDAGNVINVRINGKKVKASTYDLSGNLKTNAEGENVNSNTPVIYQYNIFNKVKKAVYPGDDTIPSNSVLYVYDVMGNLKKQQNSLGTEDLYTYDNQGRALKHTQQKQGGGEAITITTAYDLKGNKRFETDGNNNKKEAIYDELGRIVSTKTTVNGKVQETKFEYDDNGNLTKETDWKGNFVINEYDPINRLVEKKDQYQKSIQKLEYNQNSSQSKSYDALNNLTQYYYDKNNRLITTLDPEGHATSQEYDDAGNITAKTDGMGITTVYIFDDRNRLQFVINAKGEETKYTYDLSGNVLTQTDGKCNVITFEYNVANKVTKRVDQGGKTDSGYDPAKTESYTYYVDGSLATKTDRNGTLFEYTYDSHGRKIKEQAGTGTISYTYDGNGNQLTITDSTGTTVRKYDELNRVTEKTVPVIGKSIYTYDALESDGNVSETSTDPKGNITKKVFDRAGRLLAVTVGGQTTTYSYYDNGSRQRVTYPDNSSEEYSYYRDNTLKTLVNKKADGSVMDYYEYAYDAAKNLITKNETINGQVKGRTSYTYDSLNRLATVKEPGGRVTAYSYDAAGNRVSETVAQGGNTAITLYEYNEENRLLKTTTQANGATARVSYSYDNNGNLKRKVNETFNAIKPEDETSTGIVKLGQDKDEVSQDVAFYEYDPYNQLIKALVGDQTLLFTYNGSGQRVSKTVYGETTHYLYEYDKIVLEVDGAGNQKARNVYGTNLLMRDVDGQTLYYMYDGNANVTALLDASTGQVVGTYYYDAWGNIIEKTGDVNNPFAYGGYMYDSETGLYFLNARYYDPKVARFLQEDTVAGDPNDPLSLNLYTYSWNNPLKYDDPTGHWPNFSGLYSKASSLASNAWNTTSSLASNAWNTTSSLASNAWNTTSSLASNAWNTTSSLASNAWNTTSSLASNAWNTTSSFASNAWNTTSSLASNAWNTTSSFASNAWNTTSSLASNAWNTTSNLASNTWNTTSNWASNTWNNTSNWASNTLNTMSSSASNARSSVSNIASNTWDPWANKASNEWNYLSSGVKTEWSSLSSKITFSWEKNTRETANTLNDINNKYVGGLLNSINNNHGPVVATGAAVAGAFTAAASMAVAAEATASGALTVGVAKVENFLSQQAYKAIANPILRDRATQGSIISVGMQGFQDAVNGRVSPPDVYLKQAIKGAIIGTAQQQLNPKDNPSIIESMIAINPNKENINTWIGDTWGHIADTAVGILH